MPRGKSLFVDRDVDCIPKTFQLPRELWERYEALRERAKHQGLRMVEAVTIIEDALAEAVREGTRVLDERTAKDSKASASH